MTYSPWVFPSSACFQGFLPWHFLYPVSYSQILQASLILLSHSPHEGGKHALPNFSIWKSSHSLFNLSYKSLVQIQAHQFCLTWLHMNQAQSVLSYWTSKYWWIYVISKSTTNLVKVATGIINNNSFYSFYHYISNNFPIAVSCWEKQTSFSINWKLHL